MSESCVSHRSISRFSVSRFARFSVSAIRVSAFRVSKCVSVIRDSRFRIAATAIFTIIQFHHYLLASFVVFSNCIAAIQRFRVAFQRFAMLNPQFRGIRDAAIRVSRFSDSRFAIHQFIYMCVSRFAFQKVRFSIYLTKAAIHCESSSAIRSYTLGLGFRV